MDMNAYKEEFMNEVRDHLDTLNESLLILEKEPENTEIVNKLFRSFHTLKGNSAAMGYMKYSELAHKLEDLLDKIKNNEIKPTTEIVDVLFEGCDILEEGLTSIESKGTDDIETAGILETIKGFLDEEKGEARIAVRELATLSEEQKKEVEAQKSQGMAVHRMILVFDNSNPLRYAKAHLALNKLSRLYRIITTTPAKEDITQGSFGDELELIIAAGDAPENIKENLSFVSGLREIVLMGPEDKYQRKKPASAETDVHTKESEKHAIANKHNTEIKTQIRSVKIDINRLDRLMNMVGELLINKMRLQQIARLQNLPELNKVMKLVDRLTEDIQNEVTEARMVPIGNIFNRFPRMVRDLANKENKKITFSIEGQDIEFDRTILDELGDPLVHLLRNSVDHGIEMPEARKKLGKPETGTIRLTAKRDKNHAFIIIWDDGAGIDPEKVRDACIRKGILAKDKAKSMTQDELRMLIFKSGVSTSEHVTDVSGRGVGMDVVQTKINSLGGSVKLESVLNKETKVIIRLPLTVSIVSCLLIQIDKLICAIPLTNVNKTLSLRTEEIKSIKNNPVFLFMGREIALVNLRSIFGYPVQKSGKSVVVVVEKGNEKIGIVVDKILSQEQLLIKKLDKNIKNVKGIAGNTILGDGTVGLILDVNTLL
jgi:two-component system chemotaxis sensor kinase CheA